jgi:hypothetical protein
MSAIEHHSIAQRTQHMHHLLEGGFTEDTRPEDANSYEDKTKEAGGENSPFNGTGIGDKKNDLGGVKPASEKDYTKSNVKATDPGFKN